MIVGVTGGRGFVGKSLVAALEADGHRVIRFERSESAGPDSIDMGDLSEELAPPPPPPPGLTLDALIHLAARTQSDRHITSDADLRDLRTVNVQGTRRVIELARQCSARHFVFLSSIKVNGERTETGQPFLPDMKPMPEDAYGISKKEAEDLVVGLCAANGITSTIIRSPLVYGPQSKGNFALLAKVARLPVPLPFGSISNIRSMIYVENLADLIVFCTENHAAQNQIILASDGSNFSTAQLIGKLAEAQGRRAWIVRCPVGLLRLAGRLLGLSGQIRRLTDSLEIAAGETARIEWRPPIGMETAINASVGKRIS